MFVPVPAGGHPSHIVYPLGPYEWFSWKTKLILCLIQIAGGSWYCAFLFAVLCPLVPFLLTPCWRCPAKAQATLIPQIVHVFLSLGDVGHPWHWVLSEESNRPLTPIHVKKYRDTPPISIAYFCKSMPSSWQKVVYTPPICITIRLPFVSRYFCWSIRVRGRWDTPNVTLEENW